MCCRSVCLPTGAGDYAGLPATVTGWGRTDTTLVSEVLLAAEVCGPLVGVGVA